MKRDLVEKAIKCMYSYTEIEDEFHIAKYVIETEFSEELRCQLKTLVDEGPLYIHSPLYIHNPNITKGPELMAMGLAHNICVKGNIDYIAANSLAVNISNIFNKKLRTLKGE